MFLSNGDRGQCHYSCTDTQRKGWYLLFLSFNRESVSHGRSSKLRHACTYIWWCGNVCVSIFICAMVVCYGVLFVLLCVFHSQWQMKRQRSAFATGFVISGRRILTNAHAVRNHLLVRVRRYGDSKKYTATVRYQSVCMYSLVFLSFEIYYLTWICVYIVRSTRLSILAMVCIIPWMHECLSMSENGGWVSNSLRWHAHSLDWTRTGV